MDFGSRRRADCGGSGLKIRLIRSTKEATVARRSSFHQRALPTGGEDDDPLPLTFPERRWRPSGQMCRCGIEIEVRARTRFGRRTGTLDLPLRVWRGREGEVRALEEGLRQKVKTKEFRLATDPGILPLPLAQDTLTIGVHGLLDRHCIPPFFSFLSSHVPFQPTELFPSVLITPCCFRFVSIRRIYVYMKSSHCTSGQAVDTQ